MITETPTVVETTTSSVTFDTLNLSNEILLAITDLGYTTPSTIQLESIPHVFKGIDLIAQAPTGSGKTAAYAIPLLEKLSKDTNKVQALVLCPTRELVIQVHKEFEKLTKYMENVNIVSVYGGQSIDKQLNALHRNPQIIVATPGRLMDHLRRKSINLQNISVAVLDEADEMLDMGFREDIYTILDETPESRQTILFSATMAKDIIALTKKFQKTPLIIDVRDNLLNAPNIAQYYYEVVEKERPELITRLLELHNMKLALIFCNTKSNVDRLVEILKTKGYFADSLHGDMNQGQREKVMRGFKTGSVKILVATDVAGRGIDVKNVEGVFNFDLPRDDEDYIHRIGRTARAGRSGLAFSFVSKRQVSALRRIERANGLKIEKAELPSFEEITNAKFTNFANEIREIIKCDDLELYVNQINSIVDENNSLAEIAAALFKLSTKREAMKINKKIEFTKEEYFSDDDEKRRRRSRPKDRGSRNWGRSSDRFSDSDSPRSGYARKSSADSDSPRSGYARKSSADSDSPRSGYARKSSADSEKSFSKGGYARKTDSDSSKGGYAKKKTFGSSKGKPKFSKNK